jgi:hypothetical protein
MSPRGAPLRADCTEGPVLVARLAPAYLQERAGMESIQSATSCEPWSCRSARPICGIIFPDSSVFIRYHRFHEGPKKAYDSAKALLSKGKKSEALPQLNDCIAEGRILENPYPDFKEQKFDVGGASMSMLELIQVCVKERKSVQPAP